MELVIKNKKAYFEYFIEKEYEAGMQLTGSEVKSIRAKKLSIQESFCHIENGEVFVKNMNISEHAFAGPFGQHHPTRPRKLLLNRKEINRIKESLKQKGFTLIPLSVVINKKGLIKLNIGLAKGKKLYDKRESIKKRDTDRELSKIR